jgi:hypothetical protein
MRDVFGHTKSLLTMPLLPPPANESASDAPAA